MKAGKMTNEELAHNLHATIPFLTKEARHVTDADEIMREATTRLLNQGEIAVKDAEIARLRALVEELADALDAAVPDNADCVDTKALCQGGCMPNGICRQDTIRALVARARIVIRKDKTNDAY